MTMTSSAQDHHVINSANARQGNAVGLRAPARADAFLIDTTGVNNSEGEREY
jgi:hypothetical protein